MIADSRSKSKFENIQKSHSSPLPGARRRDFRVSSFERHQSAVGNEQSAIEARYLVAATWPRYVTMEIIPTEIPDVRIIIPVKHLDRRGFLSETYSKRGLAEAGIELDFVQDNHSFSVEKNVVRGLHYQAPPFAQDKLLRVVRGAVFDVAVDLRRGSPTFGKHVSVILSAEKWNQLFVPKGFAHGFATLEPSTELIYKVTNYYCPEYDRGLLWCDPEVDVDWPVSPAAAIVSEKDSRLPRLSELKDLFD